MIMIDVIKTDNMSVARKPHMFWTDGEYFPVEIMFRREITDKELQALASLAQVINDYQGCVEND